MQVGQLPAITEEIDIQVTPSRENIPNLNIKRVLTSILPMPPSLPNPPTKFYHFDFEFFFAKNLTMGQFPDANK